MIDWNRVNELMAEVGKEDFAEVLDMFFNEVAEVLSGLEKGGSDAIKRNLHFLKGSAMYIGLTEFNALCLSGESALFADPDAAIDFDAIRRTFLESKDILLNCPA
jgi:HPt (histidine-containing phosphotransfer) domain-containing protein